MSNAPQTFAVPPVMSMSVDRLARIRPMTAAVLVGAVAGLAIGCAYLGGQAARATSLRAAAERLEGATSAGFTEEALAAAAGGLDASALAIARRHDPYSVAGGAQRDRQAELLTARLEALKAGGRSPAMGGGLVNARSGGAVEAAGAFRLTHALDASRDLECLTQAAYYEARGEGRQGMQAVTQVVLNRARHPAFPKTVCGVVFQGAARRTGCQFSFTCNGSMRGPVNRVAWDRARDVASKALSGAVFASVGNATHFHTVGVSPGWRNTLIQVNQVGQHLFYRFGGRAGARSSFAYAVRPSMADDRPQLTQASLDPTGPVRQAGEAMAYTMVLAQERLTDRDDNTPAEATTAAPRAVRTASSATPSALRIATQPIASSTASTHGTQPSQAAAQTPAAKTVVAPSAAASGPAVTGASN